MTFLTRLLDARPRSLADAARWAMVAIVVINVMTPPVLTAFGSPGYGPSGPAPIALGLAVPILAIQLRHSFATARGERPRGALWTLLALVILVYLPLRWFWFGEWLGIQVAVIGSVAMLLPRRLAIATIVAIIIGSDVLDVRYLTGQSTGVLLYWLGFDTVGWLQGWLSIYGSARLVRLVADLGAARIELAELAIARERLRISRDLHDLLGQSLSAVSLKSDLAIRLLRRDPAAARAEIEAVGRVADDTLRGLRALTQDAHPVSLTAEAEGAAALLASAGVEARVAVDLTDLPPPAERLLAWSVREGVTNVLRHSQARTCTITARRQAPGIILEILNDGAPQPASLGEGSGLPGLTERARPLAATASAAFTPDGGFRLRIEIPAPTRNLSPAPP